MTKEYREAKTLIHAAMEDGVSNLYAILNAIVPLVIDDHYGNAGSYCSVCMICEKMGDVGNPFTIEHTPDCWVGRAQGLLYTVGY